MKIIDARIRISYGSEGALLRNGANFTRTKVFGFSRAQSAIQISPSALVSEMDAAGIEMALVTGRGRFADRNEELLEFARLYPGKFGVLPYLDPSRENIITEIKEYTTRKEVKGFSVQYFGDGAYTYAPLSQEALEMYSAVAATKLPLMITVSGHTVSEMDNSIITRLDRIATSFPEMPIVITHGGWPWVLDTIGLAFRRKNVYLVPDCYCTRNPGAQEYVRAANYMIPDKIMFGSSYPTISQQEIADYYMKHAGFSEEVIPKVMYDNAKRVFHI